MWELLYETFWDRLEHFCFNLCRDEARAEDLTQEVFLRALQNRTLINSFTERQCKAWLFTTARNLYCDQLRRAAKEEQLLSTFFPEEDSAEPDFALDTVEAASLLALLTPEERRLFTLRYTAGYNASEIGQLLCYEQIKLDCMIALTSPRVQALLSQHNISLDSMLCKNVPEEVSVGVVNGKVTLSSASQTAAGQVLVVNGKLMITPDAAEVLQKYACILVNGMIYCPQCLSAVVSARCILNGKLAVYPDDAVLLPGSSIKLDNTFLLRAQSRLYWNEHRFLAVDPRLDTAALAAKGCSFSAPKAILCASLAPVLAPLFPDSTELIIVPDGTAVVEDDLELTASSLRRYGTRLYVLGDAVIPAESADLLAQIEFLHVTGEVELPDALEAAFFAIPELECGKVVHEDALPKQTRAKAKDEEPDPDTVTLSGIQLTL